MPPRPLLGIWENLRLGDTRGRPSSSGRMVATPVSLSWFAAGAPARPGCFDFFNKEETGRCRPSAPAWRTKRALSNLNFHSPPRGAIAIHSRISSSKAVSTVGESALEQALRHHTRAVVFLRQSGGNQFSFKVQHMQKTPRLQQESLPGLQPASQPAPPAVASPSVLQNSKQRDLW